MWNSGSGNSSAIYYGTFYFDVIISLQVLLVN